MNMSQPNLYRKIKALTDQSPADFIKTFRLQRADPLLKTHSKNISEVAFETGFISPGHFSTSFKKYFGVSRSEYSG